MAERTENVTFPAATGPLTGYLALPDGSGPFPGLVGIHELNGLSDNMRDIARRLAREGYATLVVDLYAGRNPARCMARLISGLLFNPLDHDGIHDLRAALDMLAARPEVDASRLGAIGFCMGGSFAIAWACTDARLHAIAPFYAWHPRPLEAVRRACPIVGSYPRIDHTARSGRKLAAALREYQIPHDIKIYAGAKHSFFNDQGPDHDPAASADAWARTLAFFRQRLG
jgi:carboxymethylenebutenolidase